MRLVQILVDQKPVAAIVDGDSVLISKQGHSVYDLAGIADEANASIKEVALAMDISRQSYQENIAKGLVTSPFTHDDSSKLYVTGTGLTHTGSASTRASMHANEQASKAPKTDSMKMFEAGIAGGKPEKGEIGAEPEWFYKGDGSIVVPPWANFSSPDFACDFGEEPELAALYRIGKDGTPMRIGFALGNEASDHVTEKKNYLLLAHSKLRQCSIGPEIYVGDLPSDIRGVSKLIRNEKVIWEKEFLTGEDNMCHSIENLEYHHFKYDLFRQANSAHIHFMGTATLSFGDGIVTQEGDIFEIEAPQFGRELSNAYKIKKSQRFKVRQL